MSNPYESTVRQLVPRVPGSPGSVNPYEDAVSQLASQQRSQVTAAEMEVDAIPPDQFARGRELGAEMGLPPMVAARSVADLEAERERERFRSMTQGSPTLARWMANPENMGVARDDYEQLGALAGRLWLGHRKVGDAVTAVPRSLLQGAVGDFAGRSLEGAGQLAEIAQRRLMGGSLSDQLQDIVGMVNPEVRAMQAVDPVLYQQYRERVRDWTAPESWLQSAGGGLQAAGEAVGVPEDEQGAVAAVARGVGQVGGQLAAAPLGLALQSGLMAAQGASIQAERVEAAGETGTVAGDSATAAGALVTGVTERLGLDFLVRKLPQGVQAALRKRAVDIAMGGLGEATQEVIEGLGQDLVEYQFYNPDVDIGGDWEDDAAIGGAVGLIVRSLLHVRARSLEIRQSVEDAERLKAIQEAAAASKTGKRYPEALADFVRQAREDGQPIPDAVYLDAEAVSRVLFQQGLDPQAEMAAMAGDPDSVAEAMVTGDLRVTMERFAAYVAQRQDAQELTQHARLDPDRMTKAQADALDVDDLLAQIYGGTEAAAARAEASAQEQEAAERVRQDLIGQMLASGMDRTSAELQAQVLSNRYQTRAERRGLGESAWDVYQMSGLSITRETPATRKLRDQVEQFDVMIDPLIDAARTGKMPSDRMTFGTSLVSALVRAGGVRDSGGELRSRDALRLRPGLVSGQGMTLDEALVWARERGYVQQPVAQETESYDPNAADIGTLLELIDQELTGGRPVYSDELINRRLEGFQNAVEELRRELDRLGIDPATATNAQVKQALGVMDRGARGFDQSVQEPDRRFRIGDLPRDMREELFNEHATNTNPDATERGFYAKSVPSGLLRLEGVGIAKISPDQYSYFEGAKLKDIPPVVISDGRLIDGQHRIAWARSQGITSLRYIDVTGLIDTDAGGFISELPADRTSQQTAPTQTQTEQFRRWFRDSKIVDANGNPLVLYHGTTGDFDAFEVRRGTGEESFYGRGVYATANPDLASQYAGGDSGEAGGNVMPVFASLQNPYFWPQGREPATDLAEAQALTEELQAQGYDGVVVGADFGDTPDQMRFSEVIVFDPAGVKSSTGNQGGFDPADSRVLFQRSEDQTQTPEFRRWFGDSKVVDANGEPLVVYHGTNFDIETFKTGKAKKGNELPFGAHFTPSPDIASQFADSESGNVLPVYLSIRNPLDLTPEANEFAVVGTPEGMLAEEAIRANKQEPKPYKRWQYQPWTQGTPKGDDLVLPLKAELDVLRGDRGRAILQRAGYDGVVYSATYYRGPLGSGGKTLDRSYIAFHPEQIKSATGNRGTFDPADPRIQYQRPSPVAVERGRIEFRTDGGARIVLTENANLSTFLHETGHLWLEELITDATTAGTSPELAADLDRVLQWMGLDVRAADGADAVRAAVGTEQHESWARGFEAYLREGKAPSSALRQAFGRFRAWLLRLYQDIRALRVELSPQVREVMDRLIATDAEIDEANAQNGAELFADFEQAQALGMTASEWEAYVTTREQATREAREEVEQALMRSWSREQRDYYRQERARMRETVEAEVNQRPVYRAMLALQEPDGLKLDKAELVERYGLAFLDRLPGPGQNRRNRGRHVYALQGGTGLDQAAFLLGYDSGDAMVQALVNAETRTAVIDAETDARMQDFYPDPMTDGTLAERAQVAVHNSSRVDVIERELRVIARAAGQRPQQAAVISIVAEQIIGRQQIRSLRPRDYLVAERKAAREALEFISRRQFDLAYRAKYRQVLNARLYALASEANDRVEANRKYLRKFEETKKRQKLGKAGGTWLEQIDALIDAHDLKRVTNIDLDRTAALRELKAAADAGLITVPPELQRRMDDAQRVNWRELTVAELQALRDTVQNIDTVAMRELEMIIDGQVRDLDADAEAIAESIRTANVEVPVQLGSKTRREMLAKYGRDMLAIWNRPSDAVRNVEGQGRGPLMQRTIEVIRRAVVSKLEPMKAKAREDLAAMYQKHYSRAELVKMARFRVRVPGINQDWTRFDLLALALNWGNVDNRAAVLESSVDGRKPFNEAGVMEALRTLDARDWAFVQDAWSFIDSFWPEVSAAQKRRTGLAPKKVDAAPFEMQTRDGQTVQLAGGYYPLSYDASASPAAMESELQDIFDRVKSGGFSRAATARGHTIERVGSGGRPVRMNINVLHSHVDQVVHDLALGDAVEYVYKVLNHGDVKAAFNAVGKLESQKWLNLWLKDAAAGEMGARNSLEQAFRWIRVGFTKSRLGFNIITAALQPTGFLQSAVVVGKSNMIKGLTTFLSSPREAYKQVMERSDFMRTRYELSAWNKDVQDTMAALQGKFGLVPSWIGPAMFYMMQKTQVTVDVTTWLAAYQRGLRDYNGDDSQAATYADGVVEQAQTSGFFSDRSAIERGTMSETTRQSELVRSWTTLISYMQAKGNIAYTRVKQTDFRSVPQVVNLAGDMMMLFTIEALLVALIRGQWPDEDESWLSWLTAESAHAVLGGIPIVRDLSSAVKGFDVTGTPQAGLINDAGKAWTQIQQGEVDGAMLKSINNVGGTLFHYPSSQMNRAIDAYWRDHVEGEDVAPIEYITGRRGP